ncbi:MAG: hypothetical protein ABSB18_06650 [Candidatus Omnitrophota bacterium]
MTQKASALIVLLIGLIIVALGLGGVGLYFFQKEHAKNLELSAKLDEISTKLRLTDSMLEDSKKKIADLQSKLSDATRNIDGLSSELQQEKSMRQEALAKIELLDTQLQEQKTLREGLEKNLASTQEDARKSQAQLQLLQTQKSVLEKKVADLETKTQNIELGNIVVSSEQPAKLPAAKEKKAKPVKAKPAKPAKTEKAAVIPATGGMEGKVLVVNMEYDFVVISKGAQDGLQIGDEFAVFAAGNKYLGDIKVEKLHDNMAAAGFLTTDLKNKISEGDKVAQKVK